MKKILILVIILVGGHYAAWNHVATKAEINFHQLIENKMQYSMGTLDYELKKSGYPTNITLEMVGVDFSAHGVEMALDSSFNKGISISVPFSLNPNTFVIDSSGVNYVATIKVPEGDIAMELSMGDSINTINKHNDNYTLDGFVNDLSMNMTLSGNENIKIDIANIDVKETIEIVADKINSHIAINMTDAKVEVKAKEEDMSFNIDSYSIAGGVKNFPNTMEDLIEIITPILKQVEAEKSYINIADIKHYINSLIHQMAEDESVVYFDKLAYKLSGLPEIDTFGFDLNTKLSIAHDYTLRGNIGIKLDGLNKIADMWMKNNPSGEELGSLPPFALALMQAGTLEIDLKIDDNGFLIFNGMPVFQLPPLDGLVNEIPDVVSTNILN